MSTLFYMPEETRENTEVNSIIESAQVDEDVFGDTDVQPSDEDG
jgi:hypothetical protein